MITRYVNTASSGGDGTTDNESGATAAYATLAAGEAAEGGTLSDSLEFLCSTGSGTAADSSEINFAGWTTTAAFYVEVTTNSTETVGPVWSDSIYRIDITSATQFKECLTCSINYFRVNNIQMSRDGTVGATNGSDGVSVFTVAAGGSDIRVEECIIRGIFGTDNAGTAAGINTNDADAMIAMNNNLIYGWVNSTNGSYYGIRTNAKASGSVANYNTIIGCRTGILNQQTGDNITLIDNIVQDSNTDYSGSFNAASSYNTDEDGTAPGSNSVTDTLTFNNKGADDYRPTASDITTNPGTPVSGITVDLIGDTRDVTTPTRGCFENAAAAPTGAIMNQLQGANLGADLFNGTLQ